MRAFQGSPTQVYGSPVQTYAGTVQRRMPPAYGYAPGLARARANRALMIRRRQNVLLTLLTAVLLFGVVGFAFDVVLGKLAFFVCLLFLALYVWMLATLRRNEELRSAQRYVYSDAA
jgi:Flp pilus assembly protein TadB